MNDDDPVHHCNDCQWSNSKVHNDSLASSLAVGRALDLGILNLELLPAFVCFHSLPVLAMTSHSWNVPRLKRHVIHSFRRSVSHQAISILKILPVTLKIRCCLVGAVAIYSHNTISCFCLVYYDHVHVFVLT
jgi:hypothetical protein